MEKEGNCQSRICTYLYLTLSFMSNHCHTRENLLVLSTSCPCITAEELEGKTRRAAVITERWYLRPSDTCGYLQHPFGTGGQEAGCGAGKHMVMAWPHSWAGTVVFAASSRSGRERAAGVLWKSVQGMCSGLALTAGIPALPSLCSSDEICWLRSLFNI